jgi:2-deoxy-D-gluconate 3-dehydrogenase
MRDQEPAGGAIVNVSSIMGLAGYKDRAAYCSSKAGVVNLSRVLAFEWAPSTSGSTPSARPSS